MDHIDKVLTDVSLNDIQFSPPIRVALAISKRVMNKYYDLTDTSEVYCIVISTFFFCSLFCSLIQCPVLHPLLKIDYFHRLKWPTVWEDEALNITRTLWELRYKHDNIELVDPPVPKKVKAPIVRSHLFTHLLSCLIFWVVEPVHNVAGGSATISAGDRERVWLYPQSHLSRSVVITTRDWPLSVVITTHTLSPYISSPKWL